MSTSLVSIICSVQLWLAWVDDPAAGGPPLKALDPGSASAQSAARQDGASPVNPNVAALKTSASKPKHYVVHIKLVEVDDQGHETVLGTPRIQTTGGNAGISIDHPDGRRFDFSIGLFDGGTTAGTAKVTAPVKKADEQTTESIEKKLDQKITLKAVQQSRKAVLREVAHQAGINIAIDPESAKSVSPQLETPIDFKVENEAVTEILDRLVQPLKLGYAVKHEVVLIAVAEKLLPDPEEYSVKTYEVADLVVAASGTGEGKPDFTSIIQRIKSTVQPETWDRRGGSATIRPFNSTSSLVVRQTASGHLAIERLLESVRQDRPKAVNE